MQLLQRLLLGLFGHPDFFNLLLQIFELSFLILPPEFLMNRLDLFVEVILFLRFLHLTLHARLDRTIKLAFLNLELEQLNQSLQSRLRRKQLQQSLLIFYGDTKLRRECIGKVRRILVAKCCL